MRGHLNTRQHFRPKRSPVGGSQPGKPQNRWPLGILVVAEAVYRRSAGGMEALLHNRDWASMGLDSKGLLLKRELGKLCPGIWAWIDRNFTPTKTTPWKNLHNRVYKMYYSGSSDRGPAHDARTRAAVSGEHWTRKVPEGHNLFKVHEQVDRGSVTIMGDWKDWLL
jgi:hypothetical protein